VSKSKEEKQQLITNVIDDINAAADNSVPPIRRKGKSGGSSMCGKSCSPNFKRYLDNEASSI